MNSGNKFALDKSSLGVHWSSDEKVAQDFGGTNYMPELARVVHARIPMSSVETNKEQLVKRGYASFPGPNASNEQEVMTKEGAPVYVTGISKFKEAYGQKSEDGRLPVRKRTRTYKQPREMKA